MSSESVDLSFIATDDLADELIRRFETFCIIGTRKLDAAGELGKQYQRFSGNILEGLGLLQVMLSALTHEHLFGNDEYVEDDPEFGGGYEDES